MTKNRNTRRVRRHSGMFQSGSRHPRWRKLDEVEAEICDLHLGTLRLRRGTIRRVRGYRMIDADCTACKKSYEISVDNIRARKTTNCRCQRRLKYNDPRASALGQRYDSMVQRCYRDSHVSSHNYKDRGIEVRFPSREAFIRWALEKWPDTDFKGLDFDRIDNDGHYEPDNLRLVTRSENLKNRVRKK